MFPASFPSTFCGVPLTGSEERLPDTPFPPQAPLGWVSPLRRYYEGAVTTVARSVGSISLAFRYHFCTRLFAPAAEGYFRVGPGDVVSRSPAGFCEVEATVPPRFLGNPHAYMPCSQTPARLATPGHRGAANVAFRSRNNVGPRESHLGAPSHGLHARCLRFAARVTPGPRKTRFRLAGQPCPGGVGYPLDPFERFRATVPCCSPLPSLAWRTQMLWIGSSEVTVGRSRTCALCFIGILGGCSQRALIEAGGR